MKTWILLAFAALSLAPAQAQGRLPRTSLAEQNYVDINRNLQRREQGLGNEQQNQFEVNQFRQELNRQQLFLPPPGSSGVRICAPGQIGC